MNLKFKGAIFDLDGVITDTAKFHLQSWKEMFDKFLKEYNKRVGEKYVPFTKEEYFKYVDGKPRYQGAKSFLESRKIKLPLGKVSDGPNKKTISGLGNKKQEIYLKKIKENKIPVYEDGIKLVKKLKKEKIKIALATSSKNGKLILKETKLQKLFDVIIDGKTIENKNFFGKPHPDMFVYACKKLGLDPSECAIFEDACSGVEAGINGNFSLVVGVERNHNELSGQDISIRNLENLNYKKIQNWFSKKLQEKTWKLEYRRFFPEDEKLREVLCTTGNGYIGTRGCFETQSESENHYPGCYLAGIFDEQTTKIKNKKARNNDMVNCPNWLLMEIKIGSKIVDPFKSEIIKYEKNLDIKNASLTHKLIFKDKEDRITEIESKRFASMDNPHLCALKFKIKPLNYSEKISVYSLIDGGVENNNVKRYGKLKSKHLDIVSKGKSEYPFLHVKTKNSDYEIVTAIKHSRKAQKTIKKNKKIGEEISFNAKEKKNYSFIKIVSIFTSNDCKDPKKEALSSLKKINNFDSIFKKHKKSWEKIWKNSDLLILGDRHSQNILRLHTYHLFSTYSSNVKKMDVGVPARGLHGEAYHGHIFWDEIFILSYYIHHFPEIAKSALMYRYRRLEAAKEYAKENGYNGAMYPWQSADTGKEETQTIHFNPKDNTWGPDYSRNQRHVSISVFYNIYKYIKHTEDKKFLHEKGLEMMINITRFWEDISKFNEKTKKYHIKGIMGPDEFHEKAGNKQINDNAYTNVMVSWVMEKILELTKKIPEVIKKRLNITEEERKKWKDISENLNVITKNGIIMQFEGFEKLKELNFEKYRKKYGNIERMDRILKKEDKSPNDYKVLKQADVLMIFYVLHFHEAIKVLKRLGVRIRNPVSFLKRNYDYYSKITTHGSSLSKFVHNAISTVYGKKRGVWNFFNDALFVDVCDLQKGTTSEGIHCGLMSGTINLVRKYFAGIKTHEDGITLKPTFPSHWKFLKFKVTHKNSLYSFEFTPKEVKIKLEKGSSGKIYYKNKKYILKKGDVFKRKNINTFEKKIMEITPFCFRT